MTEKLHQINLNYDPAEDRILFRVSTTGNKEYRIWLTRRFTSLLLNVFKISLSHDIEAGSAEAKEAVLDWQAKEIIQKSNFSQGFAEQPEASFPLGKNGILAQNINYKKSGHNLNLSITPNLGEGINLFLDRDLQIILNKMLEDAIGKGQWNIDKNSAPIAVLPQPQQNVVH